MDMKSFMDQVLQSGKDMAQKGQELAEQKLGIPESGEQREQMLSGMKTGAAAAGVLAVLLGTQAGRRVTGAAVKVGSLAALGGLAYQMYKQWDADNAAPANDAPIEQLAAPEQSPKASTDVLLKAMVAAAKADGHVNSAELENIRKQLENMGLAGDANDMILEALTQPLSAKDIAALATGDLAVATEIYLISAAVIDASNEAEQAYLADLRAALQLPEEASSAP